MFTIGEDVHVSFIGTITAIKLDEGKVRYEIKGSEGIYGFGMLESYLAKLPKPEDFARRTP